MRFVNRHRSASDLESGRREGGDPAQERPPRLLSLFGVGVLTELKPCELVSYSESRVPTAQPMVLKFKPVLAVVAIVARAAGIAMTHSAHGARAIAVAAAAPKIATDCATPYSHIHLRAMLYWC